MKTLANSLRRLHQLRQLDPGITGILVENAVADDATIMQRTRFKSFGAWCRKMEYAGGNIGVEELQLAQPMIAILSVHAWNNLPLEHNESNVIEAATAVIAFNVSVNETVTATNPATGVVTEVVRNTSGYQCLSDTVLSPDTELGSLMCGTDFYVVLMGGDFTASVRLSVEFDRVTISQDEWMILTGGNGC